MPGPFDGVNMMSQALRAFQRGIGTAGHNIANVNTRGFSRQRVELGAQNPLTVFQGGWLSLGQGVSLESVSRSRDQFLETRFRNQQSRFERASTSAGELGAVLGVFNEPGTTGLSGAIDAFFDSWSGFAANPDDEGARLGVRQSGQILADQVRGAWDSLEAISSDQTRRIDETFDAIDALATQVSRLNDEIRQASIDGTAANDLLDRRDLAVRDLSALVTVTVSTDTSGAYSVHAAGYPLVDTAGSRPMPRDLDVGDSTVTADGITYPIDEGQLAGLVRGLATARGQQAALNKFANILRAEANLIHNSGFTFKEQTDVDFFNPIVDGAVNGAYDLDLSDAVKLDAGNIVAGLTGKPGDGAIAQALADLRSEKIGTLGFNTFGEFYGLTVSQIASDAEGLALSADTAQAVLNQTEAQAQAISGVSLDDETADLLKWQRGYQAAAKALAIFDQVTEDLLAMLRR